MNHALRQRFRVLYFSRGKGHSHATRDVALLEAVRDIYSDFEVQLVSYDKGAETLDRLGYAVIDLKLPEFPPFLEIQASVGRLIEQNEPDLVIAHEEFAAMPMARLFGRPAVFITHWFWKPQTITMECLRYADRILFTEDEGVFEEPPYLSGKVTYFGPVVRDLGVHRSDRECVRAQMGLAPNTKLISVMPGSWREATNPLAELLVHAFRALPFSHKRMVWLASDDATELAERYPEDTNIKFVEFDQKVGALMAASDLVVTKATYTTARELISLGVPSVSVSHRRNPVDDVFAERNAMNVALYADELDAQKLCAILTEQLTAPRPLANEGNGVVDGRDTLQKLARTVADTIRQLKPSPFKRALQWENERAAPKLGAVQRALGSPTTVDPSEVNAERGRRQRALATTCILFVNHHHFGDGLLQFGALKALHERNPQTALHYGAVRPGVREWLKAIVDKIDWLTWWDGDPAQIGGEKIDLLHPPTHRSIRYAWGILMEIDEELVQPYVPPIALPPVCGRRPCVVFCPHKISRSGRTLSAGFWQQLVKLAQADGFTCYSMGASNALAIEGTAPLLGIDVWQAAAHLKNADLVITLDNGLKWLAWATGQRRIMELYNNYANHPGWAELGEPWTLPFREATPERAWEHARSLAQA